MSDTLLLNEIDFLCGAQEFHIQGPSGQVSLTPDAPETLGSEQFDSPYLCQQHAMVKLTESGVWIMDLGSRNGSRMAGQALPPNQWQPWPLGQTVTLANCPVRVVVGDAPQTAKQSEPDISAEWLERAQQSLLQAGHADRDIQWWQDITGNAMSPLTVERCEQLLTGLGPLSPLLADPEVSEIMVLGDRPIWIERQGKITQTQHRFPNHDWLVRIIERVLRPIGREINQASPVCDGRLEDGSRVNAVLPPVSLEGPALTIRKFHRRVNSLQAWVESEGLQARWADWLTQRVADGRDILVVGGTGAGKTTLLNALAEHIPNAQRVVSIEDAAELDLSHSHWIRLETKLGGQSSGQLDARRLLINALRMRPDRLLLGEVRGGEALELVQALNTGHRGCMSTLHANHAKAATRRMEMLLMLSGLDWPLEAVKEQIACALDLVVSVERDPFGARRVSGIYELAGLDQDDYQWVCHYDRQDSHV